MVKASASRAADTGFDSCFLHGNFSGSSHTSDLKIGTPVARPGSKGSAQGLVGPVSVYVTGGIESLICNFYLSVTSRKLSEQIRS